MEVSQLTLKLVIILIPGIITTLLYEKLTERHEPRNSFRIGLLSVVFGFFCYSTLQVASFCMDFLHQSFSDGAPPQTRKILGVFKGLSVSNDIPYKEVLLVSLIALVFAYILAALTSHKIYNRVGRILHVTNKISDHNVFTDFLGGKIEWVYIRDLTKRLTYKGYVKRFSEHQETKEIVIRCVTVYNYPENDELYNIDELYLCFKSDNFVIEKATINIKQNEGRRNDRIA